MMVIPILGLASCTNEDVINGDSDNLRVSTDKIPTRSVITGSEFNKGDRIGVFAIQSNSAGYTPYTTGSTNIATTYDGTNWSLSSDVHLTQAYADVYAYYPYTSGNTSVTKIAVDITPNATTGQNDYLYGVCSTVNIKNPEARIPFKFALSRLTFNVTKNNENDIDSLVLNSVQIANYNGSDVAITTQGTLNLSTGDITKIYNWKTITIPVASKLSSSKTTAVEMLVIPTIVDHNAQLTFTINNQPFTVVVPSIVWQKGNQYTYPVKFTKTAKTSGVLTIGNPVITAWNQNTESTLTTTTSGK